MIEVDGDTHVGRENRDAARTAVIESKGFRVLRFSNRDVMENIDGVLANVAVTLNIMNEGRAA